MFAKIAFYTLGLIEVLLFLAVVGFVEEMPVFSFVLLIPLGFIGFATTVIGKTIFEEDK